MTVENRQYDGVRSASQDTGRNCLQPESLAFRKFISVIPITPCALNSHPFAKGKENRSNRCPPVCFYDWERTWPRQGEAFA